ncbi:MAG: zf-TFIIB domain-containing protein [Hyphomicrobiales bacterium]
MRLSDEEWLARARARYAATGEYVPEELPVLTPEERAAIAKPETPAALPCPYCADHPPLEVYARHEVVANEPLRYCPHCYGFWARRDALVPGVHDPNDHHPAFSADLPPGRCRLCFGHIKLDGSCQSCGNAAPPAMCPSCRQPMYHIEQQGITLDRCDPCDGIWFDMGEIARVYGLRDRPGLAQPSATSWSADPAEDREPVAPWQLAAEVVLGMVLPNLRFF